MAIVYRHIRLDKNEPFYIGIGKDLSRALTKHSRSTWWKKIVAKTDYRVDILFDDLTWDQACDKEREFIRLYGRRDIRTGILVNMTDGGEGILGYRHSIETIKKFTEKLTGRISPMKGKKHSIESLKKISESKKGKHIKTYIHTHIPWNKGRGKINIIEASKLWNLGYSQKEIAIIYNSDQGSVSRLFKNNNITR